MKVIEKLGVDLVFGFTSAIHEGSRELKWCFCSQTQLAGLPIDHQGVFLFPSVSSQVPVSLKLQ